jgi:hypothetical protein
MNQEQPIAYVETHSRMRKVAVTLMDTHAEDSPDTETIHVNPTERARYRAWQQAAQTTEEDTVDKETRDAIGKASYEAYMQRYMQHMTLQPWEELEERMREDYRIVAESAVTVYLALQKKRKV